jgi:hypothetical protein
VRLGYDGRTYATNHSLRKYFKTRCELAGMKPINIENLMGHSIGISDYFFCSPFVFTHFFFTGIPSPPYLFLKDPPYYVWLQAEAIKDIQKRRKVEQKSRKYRRRLKDKKTISWIEKLLDKPLDEEVLHLESICTLSYQCLRIT